MNNPLDNKLLTFGKPVSKPVINQPVDSEHNGGRSTSGRSDGEPPQKRVKRTLSLHPDINVKLDQCAYWERLEFSDVVELALEAYFQDKDYQPIPEKPTKHLASRRFKSKG